MTIVQVKRTKLNIEADFEGVLIGLVTQYPDYHVAWLINQALHQSLERVEDHCLPSGRSRTARRFTHFYCGEQITRTGFHLLANRRGTEYLLPELRELDYFLLVMGSYYIEREAEMLDDIKHLEHIQAAVPIDLKSLRSKNILLPESPGPEADW